MSKFRSGFEKDVAAFLKAKRVKHEYEPKDKKLIYVTEHTYLPDMVLANGIHVECKGWFKASDMKKMKAVIANNPNKDIRMVFQAPNNKISKKSKTTYAQWCDKNKIKWGTLDDIPKWSKEKPLK